MQPHLNEGPASLNYLSIRRPKLQKGGVDFLSSSYDFLQNHSAIFFFILSCNFFSKMICQFDKCFHQNIIDESSLEELGKDNRGHGFNRAVAILEFRKFLYGIFMY